MPPGLLPFLSALLLWASFHPLNIGVLGFVCLVPLLEYARTAKGRKPFFITWLAGALGYTAGFIWLRHTVPAGPYLLGIYHGFYWAVFLLLVRRLGLLWSPVVWTALEFLRSRLFGGFPWFNLGTTQHEASALIQIADLGGVWLVSLLVVGVNAALLDGRRGARWTAAGALALSLIYGWVRVETLVLEDGPLISIVQPNIPQDIKYISIKSERQAEETYEKHMELTRRAAAGRPDLIFWPEAAVYKGLLWDVARNTWAADLWYRRVLAPAQETGIPVVVGLLVAERGEDGRWGAFTNSAVLVDPAKGITARFDKVHLVPFAEFVPFARQVPLIRDLIFRFSGLRLMDMRPGTEFPLWQAGKWRYGPQICFEAIFPEISREIARKGAAFTVNISNDGWFRDSAELDQMQVQSRFRSIENRISVVRATNTGISALIDPAGRAHAVLESGGRIKEVEGVLTGRVRVTSAGSLYRIWGDWVAWLAAGAAIGEIARRIFVDRKRRSA